ncbi:7,8-dihydropterin-6-yl-methyl-4-(beta-D-ribofuranosyl)aminobenzene 5'-phosphate synthase [Candidatus Methanomarinus sp.]|jgi:7,8-dihydropterin-6-yl-methyl-4-(beta-D-ribofuranosyl)aminobenzene 5'-phosphate synthase|nr:7,8-dihydropterin-6-yl-methyl-4-(beta-D-ribofuranosyl)aminobenzene 5'-phosphate synthase [ANME-2 cluster archaeon]
MYLIYHKDSKDDKYMKLTITYDNEAEEGFISGWGFSCLIETDDNTILFDTGWDGAVLLHNLRKLNIILQKIDTVVISHQHWDHLGGLSVLLNMNPDVKVYVPKSFSKQLKDEISARAELVEIDQAQKIANCVYTTGELGDKIKEQSLVVGLSDSLFIITGCSHPGLAAIMKAASGFGDVSGLIGGLHDSKEYGMLEGLDLIASCHCTKYKDEIARRFGDVFRSVGVGWSYTYGTFT